MTGTLVWLCLALASPDELLQRIRLKMKDNLARLPNYTCQQTIERTMRPAKERRFQPVDTLRLEVSFVGGKELYAWPGAEKFEDRPIQQMVSGTIGTGNFALHADAVFLSGAPVFTFVGEEGGSIRYDFRVPLARSKFYIRTTRSAAVGYHGSFWVDAATLDLQKLAVQADDIPADLELKQAGEVMEYGRARIGESEFLLPRSSELIMTESAGGDSRNRTQFSACRQYAGESQISFGEPVAAGGPAAAAPATVELPAGLAVETALNTTFDSSKAAVGDPVAAVATRDVRKDGAVVIPKGAVLSGRLTRAERREARMGEYLVLGFRFDRVEFEGKRASFTGTLEDAGIAMGSRYFLPFAPRFGQGPTIWSSVAQTPMAPPGAGEGVLFVRGGHQRVSAGLRLVWKTE